jgi:hypothetical protein
MAKCDEKQENLYPDSDPDPLKPGDDEGDLSCSKIVLRRFKQWAAYVRWLVFC